MLHNSNSEEISFLEKLREKRASVPDHESYNAENSQTLSA